MQTLRKYKTQKELDDAAFDFIELLRMRNPERWDQTFHKDKTVVKEKVIVPDNEITDRIGWRWSEKQLHVFYLCLFRYGFINCELEEFKSHFFGIKNPKRKIIWLKYKANLIYIFNRLMDEKVFPEDKKIASILFEHFRIIEKNDQGKKDLKDIPVTSTNPVLSDFKKKDNIYYLDEIVLTVKNPSHPKIDLN